MSGKSESVPAAIKSGLLHVSDSALSKYPKKKTPETEKYEREMQTREPV
jgi:predicted transcriptional regulator